MTDPFVTSELQSQFATEGYALLSDALPKSTLQRWQDIAAVREAEAIKCFEQGEPMAGACVVEIENAPARLLRYDNVFHTDPEALLDLLATPALLAVARDICGPLAVPMQADILFKYQHPHSLIAWHQGAPHDRSAPYLNVGIYLDDAPEGDGCLRYVPRTQHGLEDIAALTKSHGWEIPGVIEQSAQAGDILVQDMMILHGSQPKHSPGARRTIYVEYRPYDAIIRGDAQSKHWADLRLALMGAVLARANPADRPKNWETDYPVVTHEEALELFKEILAFPEPPIPSVYSERPVEHPAYPIPEGFELSG
jgi:hypothetical protein